MSAATAAREARRKDGLVNFLLLGIAKVYKGTLVNCRNDGYAYPARSGTSTDVFAGVADETVDNSGGSAGALGVRVLKDGSYVFATDFTAVQGDVGLAVYANDDTSVTKTSSNNQLVGYIQEIISTSAVRVRINRAVQ